MKSLQNTIF